MVHEKGQEKSKPVSHSTYWYHFKLMSLKKAGTSKSLYLCSIGITGMWAICICFITLTLLVLYFDLRPGPKILFQGNTPEGNDTFQRPVIERCSCQQTPRGLETRCGRKGHTRPRGPSESPDGVDPNIRRTRKTQRDGHNSGVKIWSLCSVSSIISHATLQQPFRTLAIKWEVNMLKKPSCVFLHASLLLCRCDAEWMCK